MQSPVGLGRSFAHGVWTVAANTAAAATTVTTTQQQHAGNVATSLPSLRVTAAAVVATASYDASG